MRLAWRMDVSGLLLIPMTALITALWIGVAGLSSKAPTLRLPFLLSYGLGVLSMQPWLIASWRQAGMFAVMAAMLPIPIAVGCLIGTMAAMVAIAVKRWLARPEQ